MGVFQNNLLAGAGGQAAGAAGFYDYQIEQSARFDAASSSYLSRTPSGAGSSDKILTISFWAKPTRPEAGGGAGNTYWVSQGTSSSSRANIFQYADDSNTDAELNSQSSGNDMLLTTNNSFRGNIVGWSHLVLRIDTTQSTEADRVRFYLNGSEMGFKTSYFGSADYPGQNETLVWNTTAPIYIGSYFTGILEYDGYFAEFIMADGQSYAPTQFGESKNGVWIPKDPSGTTFGNNGFHLKFENASDLGNDSSGNNNDFTASNMGTDHQVLDSPTFGS